LPSRRKVDLSDWVVAFVIGWLVISWTMVYAVDIANLWGLHDYQVSMARPYPNDFVIPLVWFNLYFEGAPTEIFQWFMLAGGVFCCGVLFGRLTSKGYANRGSRFFLFVGIGMCFMVIEDAGNLRHHLAWNVGALFGLPEEGQYRSLPQTLTEFTLYALIGFFMAFPLWRYLRYVKLTKKALIYLIVGYTAYGVASIASASRGFGDWYIRLGEEIIRLLNIADMPGWEMAIAALADTEVPLSFWVVDLLIEESIEFLGAGFLLASLLVFIAELDNEVTSSGVS
jgi:hypothetical protein